MLAKLINWLRKITNQKKAAFPCPVCWREMDHYRNVDRNAWGVCGHCNATWLIGRNVFSSWMEEDHQIWEDNNSYLSQFKDVTPEGVR